MLRPAHVLVRKIECGRQGRRNRGSIAAGFEGLRAFERHGFESRRRNWFARHHSHGTAERLFELLAAAGTTPNMAGPTVSARWYRCWSLVDYGYASRATTCRPLAAALCTMANAS
jgi:hypothetical protein